MVFSIARSLGQLVDAIRSLPAQSSGERRMERETGFEPATSTLARSHSTTELFPLAEPQSYHSHAAADNRLTAGLTRSAAP